MNGKLGIFLVTLAITALVGGDYILSLQVKDALEVEVTDRTTTVFIDGSVEAVVEVVITNNHSLPAKLTGATLTTYIGGNQVGSETIERLVVDGNSEVTLIYHPEEDWAEVPAMEPSLTPMFDFEVNSKTFIFQNKFEKNALLATTTPDSILETPSEAPLEMPTEAPTETPIETPADDDIVEVPTETVIDDALFDEFARNIQSGGPPKDGIPPIDVPNYISVQEADGLLGDDDVVFILESSNPVKIYPQYILVFHEIVNEELDGEPISITYCPLTGSAICYKGGIQTAETTFGTSGKLLNSNLVMYDRATDSYWPQILGSAINGPSRGEGLETTPVSWTLWGLAKAEHPKALVLSENTGYLRNYGYDPYGSYTEDDSYYQAGGPFFPVMNTDDRLPSKEVVVAIKTGDTQLAIRKSSVTDTGVVNLKFGGIPMVAIYDESLDVVRVYHSQVNGETIEFTLEDGAILDGSGSTWNVRGQAVEGVKDDEFLTQISHFDVMWFAWSAFYPDSEIIQ
jgi:hypothetical protein